MSTFGYDTLKTHVAILWSHIQSPSSLDQSHDAVGNLTTSISNCPVGEGAYL